ncbi:MAG: helix-turn-helix domain-containing protein [Acidimicrobiia bacterium]
MDLTDRARSHAALGDPQRLALIDALALGDRTVFELAETSGMKSNLLAHHLGVLEEAGLIERRVSDGDRRRRYVSLRWDRLPHLPHPHLEFGSIVFVCTHNSARSQFASALWDAKTATGSSSVGGEPARRVHPLAVQVAAEFGIDLATATPAGYESLDFKPDLVVSVCDRARESGLPRSRARLHWSVPDPVEVGTKRAFRDVFAEIEERVDRLAETSAGR